MGGFYFGGYGLYLLFSLPALILGFWAQIKVQSAFNKYSRIRTFTGLTGAEVARRILDSHGLTSVKVEQTSGFLSDHYDPISRTLRLSPNVYRSNSIAAAGIAAHEAGHALQHAENYFPLQIRSAIVPTVQIGSWLGPIIFMLGLFLLGNTVAWVGLILFAATAVFALITLPVEFDASNRAKAILATSGMVYNTEMQGIHSVLDAAALTYVAAAIQAVSTVLYYLFLLSGRQRD
ncbi:MAG TPA: zinc metallopeptidase [Anaerolinea thermolimosa]|uniref:Zinc metallopeptidase n=1 Tax=Anaerolinea thermolimosa TaxID=229919 RepID=A0A3D1JIZ8_9CHLR|nr:zinc metallopeptidase [Anaerolinea thermolimosa]GAP06253.1 predicted Zn-dependent protease [Anaerolinea thermolimosa]HCE18549.1 zinc metallopeptidase [Anaerolinea thermolimosa]